MAIPTSLGQKLVIKNWMTDPNLPHYFLTFKDENQNLSARMENWQRKFFKLPFKNNVSSL